MCIPQPSWSGLARFALNDSASASHHTVHVHIPRVAVASAGRVLNVAVSAADTNEPPRVLNYMTAPNVIVWSAVACSSAFPYLFKPQELLSKNERGVIVT